MEENLIEISDILNTFDLNEIKKMLENQILSDEAEYNNDNPIDYYKPLYVDYCNIFNNPNIDNDVKNNIEIRFNEICNLFLDIISQKYQFTISEEWLSENQNNLKALTLALYSFFIIDYKNIVTSIIINYINKNYKEIYNLFNSLKGKKDASTSANKKNLPTEFNIIVSNIHIISEWIMDNIETTEELFQYIDKDYLFYPIIYKLINEEIISGRICYNFSKIFKKSLTLKGTISFEVISSIKNQYLNK